MSDFEKKYNKDIEDSIYKNWLENDLFNPEKVQKLRGKTSEEKFIISLPPPNVTGVLHLGHALMLAIEDVMVRYARMSGKETLWIPGTDHAGISTQVVVEKKLLKEKNLTRHNLGREKFMDKIWEWVKFSRGTIISQIKKMGSSVDWSREQFTMSEKLSRAVRKSFSNLYNSGKIYQSSYIVNRCPRCQTVLSDIEIDYQEQKTKLYYIRYFIEGKGDSITVATVRPETIFADMAVAVHPKDRRYKKFIGKNVLIPIINKPIPVIADENVQPDFGTGALKITPAHDPLDYEIGKRHNLPLDIFAIDKDGNMTELASIFAGKDIEEVFPNIIQYLDEIGNLEKTEDYLNKVPTCERCATRLQPLVSNQWFVDVKESADKSIDLVRSGQTNIYPERFNKTFFDWLENIRPWCISRQLWWGHRIPVWYCANGHKNVWDEDYISTNNKGNKKIILSLIVFNLIADTRLPNPFNIEELINLLLSDSLTPQEGKIYQVYMKVYGEKFKNDKEMLSQIAELNEIFDSVGGDISSIIDHGGDLIDLLENSNLISKIGDRYKFNFICQECGNEDMRQDDDVLDTWFSSGLWPFSILGWPEQTPDYLKYYPNDVLETGYDIIFFWVARMMMMGVENTGKKPFDNIYLHGLVRDEKGAKMSKSKGNSIDPLDIIKDYGADALRLSLLIGVTPGNEVKYGISKIDYPYRFINKLWNASRFIHMNVIGEGSEVKLSYDLIKNDIAQNVDKLNDFDKWILTRINNAIADSCKYMDKFMIGEIAGDVISLTWNDFCDWYIELSKVHKSEYTDKILLYSISTILKLLHPFAPFVTEKLWGLLGFEGFLMISDVAQNLEIGSGHNKVGVMMDVISEIRNLKNSLEIKPHEKIQAILQLNSNLKGFFESNDELLKKLINADEIKYISEKDDISKDYVTSMIMDINLGVKFEKELNRREKLGYLESDLKREEEFLQSIRELLGSEGFMVKAPANVVADKQKKMEEVKIRIVRLQHEINKIKMENR